MENAVQLYHKDKAEFDTTAFVMCQTKVHPPFLMQFYPLNYNLFMLFQAIPNCLILYSHYLVLRSVSGIL